METIENKLLTEGFNLDENLTYTTSIWKDSKDLEANLELAKSTFQDKNLVILYLKKLLIDLKLTEYIYQIAIQTAKKEEVLTQQTYYEAREKYNDSLVKYVEKELRAIQ